MFKTTGQKTKTSRVVLAPTRLRHALNDADTASGRYSSRVGIGFHLFGDTSDEPATWPCMHSHQHAVGT